MKRLVVPPILLFILASAWIIFGAPPLRAVADEPSPLDIGVDEKLGAQVPLDLTFLDQEGKKAKLAEFFPGGPVILTLNYYSCPTLCPLVFRNLARTMGEIKGLSPSRDYSIITVSFDRDETVARAHAKAEESWGMVPGMADPSKRWPFLLGDEAEIGRLSGTVGFRFDRIGANNYAHPAALIILTPDGKVARYLYGLEIRPADLKLALVEASGGKIGGSPFINQVLLYCYHYDPVGKKYSLAAINIMKIAGAGVLLFLGGVLLSLWLSDKRRRTDGAGGVKT